jgi:hypothetical protein
MLTVSRSAQAAARIQVMGGMPVAPVAAEDPWWVARDTPLAPWSPSQTHGATADETLQNPGMECCLMHSWACSSVTAVGHMPFAATVPPEKQGRCTGARDVHGARGENPHNIAARELVSGPCCC